MRKNYLLAAVGLLTICGTALADNWQTLTIDGQEVGQRATRITFDGDDAVLLLSDNTTRQVDMELVSLSFEWDASVGVTAPKVVDEASSGNIVFDLQGRQVNGGQMNKGLYLIRKNGKTVKVIKR